MTSKKLRKYLAYYQKTLREEPDNIEARLRLAAIFRDMGREAHAIDEYVTASKLLAREGLPLEAIAACKAVLELDPQHTETQLFLARMYARVPDAAGGTARIARPVESAAPAARRMESSEPKAVPGTDELPITLSQPKQTRQKSASDGVLTAVGPGPEDETAVSSSGLIEPNDPPEEPTAVSSGPEVDTLEETRQADAAELPDLEDLRVTEEREETKQLGAVSRVRNDVSPDEDERRTVEMAVTDRESVMRAMAGGGRRDDEGDLRTTIDVEDDDILAEQHIDEPAHDDAPRRRRTTSSLDVETPLEPTREARMATAHGLPSMGDGPITRELVAGAGDDWEETFEVGVFDMDSLRLDGESSGNWDDLSFLDELDEPDTSELTSGLVSSPEASMLRVSRSELPEIPLFSQLDPSVFMQLLRVMDHREVAAGTPIVEPGRTERSLYIIVRGEVVVTRNLDDGTTVALARMGEGEFFGEFALLTGRSQMATVSAATDLSLLEVREDVLNVISEDHPEIWDVLWDFYHARMLNNMLASSSIFRSLTDEQRHELASKFTLEEVPSGELLLGEGEHDYDLYLICNGQVRVERPVAGGPPREIDLLREGEFVGLISSAEEEPVVANLRATRDTTLLVLPGHEFRKMIKRSPLIEREVRRAVRERKAIAGRYTSGVTSYAELGLAHHHADSAD